MSVLGEIFEIMAELKQKYGYRYNMPNIYGIADFRRNEFVFYGKKAIREWIRRNAKTLDRDERMYLSQVLNKAIMILWNYPELKTYFDELIENIISVKGYGLEAWGMFGWGD